MLFVMQSFRLFSSHTMKTLFSHLNQTTTHRFVRFNAIALCLACVLTACGGGGSDTAGTPLNEAAATQDVTIQFAAVAGAANTVVNCNTPLTALGRTPTQADLADLRFYLTDVQLVNEQGVSVPITLARNEWQYTQDAQSVTLIDLENAQGACSTDGTAATNAVIRGKVPPGTYVKLKATLGVPEKLSHSDLAVAPAPLDVMAMGWSWQTGRKFAKVEIKPKGGVSTPVGGSTSVVDTYPLHLASTNCTGNNDGNDTCAKKNLTTVALDFDPVRQQVAFDVAELFSTSDIRANQNDAVGCMSAMSDLDCPAVFSKLGLNLQTGTASSSVQTVFRAITK